MPEPFSEQQLGQLEERWRRDPGSRVFLQLAEELRRGGRIVRAIEVLRAGLVLHPAYLSAQVALGRCLHERGDLADAAEVLEKAVAQDPAQLVASRLLIETYIGLADAGRARSRFDFYRLFNDRDSELAQLEERIRALERRGPRGAGGADQQPFAMLVATPATAPLEFAPMPHDAGRDEQPFGALGAPAAGGERFLSACQAENIFRVPAPRVRLAPRASLAPVAPPAAAALAELEAEVETPVAAPAEPAQDRPWWSVDTALRADDLAPSAPEATPAAEVIAPAPAPAAAPPAAEPPWRDRAAGLALEPEPLFAATFSPREIGAEVERETIEEPFDEVYSVAATTAVAPGGGGAASVTLAELYLEQGHLDEAERAFGAVLLERPGDAAAVRGLADVARRREIAAASAAAPAWEPEAAPVAPVAAAGRLSQRKAGALRAYLERLRRGTAAHVS